MKEEVEDQMAAKLLREVTLQINARVLDSALFMRMSLATATVNDGREVEVAQNISGDSILITVQPAVKEGKWVVYNIPVRAFVEAVLNEEDRAN